MPAPQPTEPELRQELLERVKSDQDIRNELIKAGLKNPDPNLMERMASIDAENLKRIKEVVAKYGWPTMELVGRDGVEASFLLVQHGDLEFQTEMLPFVEASYEKGELSGQSFALLKDRVLVGQGKPQIFGTQAKSIDEWNGNEPTFAPIEDEANVDKRREKVGLPPLAEYAELLHQMYFPSEQPKK